MAKQNGFGEGFADEELSSSVGALILLLELNLAAIRVWAIMLRAGNEHEARISLRDDIIRFMKAKFLRVRSRAFPRRGK